VRRLRTAVGWPGKASHDCRPSGFLPLLDQEHGFDCCSILDSLERSGGSRCYPILEAPEGSVDCVHQFRRPLLSSQERPSLQVSLRSRHPTRRRRGLTRTRLDRSRYPGQMSRRWLTTRRRAATPRNLQAPRRPAPPPHRRSPDHVEKRMMGRLDFGRQPEPECKHSRRSRRPHWRNFLRSAEHAYRGKEPDYRASVDSELTPYAGGRPCLQGWTRSFPGAGGRARATYSCLPQLLTSSRSFLGSSAERRRGNRLSRGPAPRHRQGRPLAEQTRLIGKGAAGYRRLVPLTTISTWRLPRREQTSRSRQSSTGVGETTGLLKAELGKTDRRRAKTNSGRPRGRCILASAPCSRSGATRTPRRGRQPPPQGSLPTRPSGRLRAGSARCRSTPLRAPWWSSPDTCRASGGDADHGEETPTAHRCRALSSHSGPLRGAGFGEGPVRGVLIVPISILEKHPLDSPDCDRRLVATVEIRQWVFWSPELGR
jgi:hypothetical protein